MTGHGSEPAGGRGPSHYIITGIAAATLLLLGLFSPSTVAHAAPRAEDRLVVDTDRDHLDLAPTPCSVARIVVSLTNNGPKAIYGDALIESDGLQLSAHAISSYLPRGYTFTEELQVRTTAETEAGENEVLISAGDSTAKVTITVSEPDFGGNLARRGMPTASSVYPGRPPCGAVDGNKDSDRWSDGVGWSDRTNSVFPDWWQLAFHEPTTLSRVDLYTIDSESLPAVRQGLRDWDVQVLQDSGWQTVATVTGNEDGMASSTFPPVTTIAMRILCRDANGNYSRILELEAFA